MSKLELACNNCGETVYKMPSEVRSKNVYCDRKCLKEFRDKTKISVSCTHCGKVFSKQKSELIGKNTFCSRICKDEWQKVGLAGDKNNFYGKKHTQQTIDKIRKVKKEQSLIGKENPRYNRIKTKCDLCGKNVEKIPYLIKRSKSIYCSNECRSKAHSDKIAGKSNPNYNPLLAETDRLKRMQVLGYAKFKNDVKRRDGNMCVICHSHEDLIVHHLNSYHWDKENRLNVDNATTLCNSCHREFHTKFGYINNTKQQFKTYFEASIT